MRWSGLEEDAPWARRRTNRPGGEVGDEFVEFDGVLRDAGPAGPDFGVDAANKREEESEGSGSGAAECGPVGAGGFVNGAGEIEEETGEEKYNGKLDELGVEVAKELPKFHRGVQVSVRNTAGDCTRRNGTGNAEIGGNRRYCLHYDTVR